LEFPSIKKTWQQHCLPLVSILSMESRCRKSRRNGSKILLSTWMNIKHKILLSGRQPFFSCFTARFVRRWRSWKALQNDALIIISHCHSPQTFSLNAIRIRFGGSGSGIWWWRPRAQALNLSLWRDVNMCSLAFASPLSQFRSLERKVHQEVDVCGLCS